MLFKAESTNTLYPY